MQTIFIRVFAKKINKTNTGSIDSIQSSGVAGFRLTAFATRQSVQECQRGNSSTLLFYLVELVTFARQKLPGTPRTCLAEPFRGGDKATGESQLKTYNSR